MISSQQLSASYKKACLLEVESLKPGNVHIYADGHGMTVHDFINSAEASAQPIALAEVSLGQRIYQSVAGTWNQVGCNTNLGIILLCAPIIQAAMQCCEGGLRQRLRTVLETTSIADAKCLFDAIKLANPAGLGESDRYDVHQTPECTLVEAMVEAADRDFIALQYQNSFKQIFEEGVPVFQQAQQQWDNITWGVTTTYLYWLSHYPDTHIVRKFGTRLAAEVQIQAQQHYRAFLACSNPRHYLTHLLAFDQALKRRQLNPGTSADLTVVTILAADVL